MIEMTILELREAIWKKDEIKKNALVVFALLIEKIFFVRWLREEI